MPELPGVNHLDAVRALQKAGFSIRRQGKHIVMSNGSRILTIPRHNPVNAMTMGTIVAMRGSPSKSFGNCCENCRSHDNMSQVNKL